MIACTIIIKKLEYWMGFSLCASPYVNQKLAPMKYIIHVGAERPLALRCAKMVYACGTVMSGVAMAAM